MKHIIINMCLALNFCHWLCVCLPKCALTKTRTQKVVESTGHKPYVVDHLCYLF